jgi:hypothetical protein
MDHIKAGKQGFAGLRLQEELITLSRPDGACFNRLDCEAGIGAEAVLRRPAFSLASSEIARAKIWRFAQQVRRQIRWQVRRQATFLIFS